MRYSVIIKHNAVKNEKINENNIIMKEIRLERIENAM